MPRTEQDSQHRPGLSTQDWAQNIRNHTFPYIKHSQSCKRIYIGYKHGGMEAYPFMLFLLSGLYGQQLRTCLYVWCMQTHPMCLHLGFFIQVTVPTMEILHKHGREHRLVQASHVSTYVSNVVYFQEICQRPKFIAEGATRFDVEQGE